MGENVLSREELAALLDDGGKGRRERKVVDVDLTRPSRLGPDQLKLLTRLHEGLALRLAAVLSPLLRAKLQVELVSLTEQSFSSLRGSLPQASACHLLGLAPLPERGLLVFDPKLAARPAREAQAAHRARSRPARQHHPPRAVRVGGGVEGHAALHPNSRGLRHRTA